MADTLQNDRLLLSYEAAAHHLGLGRTKVVELVRTGEIDSVRAGRRRLISVVALQRWIQQQEEAGREERGVDPVGVGQAG